MRNRFLALLVVMIASVPLAWSQAPPERIAPPSGHGGVNGEGHSGGHHAPGGHTDKEESSEKEKSESGEKKRRRFSLFHREEHVAESAEEAEEEHEASKHKPFRIWFRGEYLYARMKGPNFPTLVTTGDATDPRPGNLGSPSTVVLYGGNAGVDYQYRNGARFTAGISFDEHEHFGFELSYHFLGRRQIGQNYTSPGNPVLAIPFFNANTLVQDSALVAYPGMASGRIDVDTPSLFQGAEANFTRTWLEAPKGKLEALLGFRYLNLYEGLHLSRTSNVALAPQFLGRGIPFDGNTIEVNDSFDTHNHFYGGQLGGRGEVYYKRFIIDGYAKVALGFTNEVVFIRGFTNINTQPQRNDGAGLFAVSGNTGQYGRNVFAVVPEAGVNLRFRLTDSIRIFGGYSFLYWSHVSRPGQQIDTTVNVNKVPTSNTFGIAGGPGRPAFPFNSTDFHIHGANFGLEFHY